MAFFTAQQDDNLDEICGHIRSLPCIQNCLFPFCPSMFFVTVCCCSDRRPRLSPQGHSNSLDGGEFSDRITYSRKSVVTIWSVRRTAKKVLFNAHKIPKAEALNADCESFSRVEALRVLSISSRKKSYTTARPIALPSLSLRALEFALCVLTYPS